MIKLEPFHKSATINYVLSYITSKITIAQGTFTDEN